LIIDRPKSSRKSPIIVSEKDTVTYHYEAGSKYSIEDAYRDYESLKTYPQHWRKNMSHLRFVRNMNYRYPEERFSGRGIVIAAGGTTLYTCAWVCINMLRHHGCTLPIELWYLGPIEMDLEMIRLMEGLGVKCVDAYRMRIDHPARTVNGWELKPYAITHSRFEEVLFLDADNVVTMDPSFLFDTDAYKEKGAIFWADREGLNSICDIWKVCEIPHRDEPEVESGQLVINKRVCWKSLQVCMHLNEYSDFFYNFVYGDKDTYHMAWRVCGQDYAMPDRRMEVLGRDTLCHHDFKGRRIFQHIGTGGHDKKWNFKVKHVPIDGFLFEDECVKYKKDLEFEWDGVVHPERDKMLQYTKDEINVMDEVKKIKMFIYERWGEDCRYMELLSDNVINKGKGDREQKWDVETRDGEVRLNIFGFNGITCSLVKTDNAWWRGYWNVEKKMLVNLIPRVFNDL